MRIKSLSIRAGYYEKTFRFSEGTTLIWSGGVNSVGKTTLVRMLLYAMGEAVPGTQGFRAGKHDTRLVLVNDDGKQVKLIRNAAGLRAVIDGDTRRYALPNDLAWMKEEVLGVRNDEVANNLLGTFYIDQDKGWTLLNRGKVISGIPFNIEALIRGLSGRDYKEILGRIRILERDIERYEFFVSAAGYKDKLVSAPGMSEIVYDVGRERNRLSQLKMQNASLSKRISDIRRAQKDNERFASYIDSMKLRVRVSDGDPVRVTRDNLLEYSNNEEYLNGEILTLLAEREEVKERIRDIESAGEDYRLFRVESDADKVDDQILALDLDLERMNTALKSLRAEKQCLESRLKTSISSNQPVYDAMTQYVTKHCEALEVEEYFKKDERGILTSDLKRKSGTNYHMLVFAFRLAYAKAVWEFGHVKMPLIIDSIRGRELSEQNFARCMSLLRSDFDDRQVIIASISDDGIKADEKIEVSNRLMDGAAFVTDIGEWEQVE